MDWWQIKYLKKNLHTKYVKVFFKLNNKKIAQFLKRARIWKDTSIEKMIHMSNKHVNRCSMSLIIQFSSVQFSSVSQLCLTLCDPMKCSTPGLPVHHYLPEFTQTHVHRVSDAVQPSHPLSCPSPPAPNPSQHQGLFQWKFK